MIKDITIGQYYPGDSPLHKMDPRMKIVVAMVFIVAIFLVKTWWGYLAVLLFFLLALFVSRLPVKFMLKSVKPLLFIIILTFVLNLFLSPEGNALFQWGFLRVTDRGLEMAAMLSLRLIFLVLSASLLTLTTSPIALTDGIERLLSPLKVIHFPAHELAMMMTIALRFIPTLLEETDKIMKAQMARGADFESGNILRRAKAMVPLLVPLFVSAFRRADELAMAMEARCYKGGSGRTHMKVLHLARRDHIALTAVAVLVALLVLERVFL